MATLGRPTIFTQELADTICERISDGESLITICKDDGMPKSSTVYNWLLDETKKDFLEQYARARNKQAEHLFEEILKISDDGSNDYVETEDDEGNARTVFNHEHVQRSRLRVDTRKWYLSKVLPKKYGEKLDVTSDGKAIKGNSIVFTNFGNDAESKQ